MKLVKPHLKYISSYLKALKEFSKETSEYYDKLDSEKIAADPAAYVKMLHNQTKGKDLPKGYVPCTQLWLVKGEEFIGHVSIRHTLTPYLRKLGGHIGYYIRPTMRKRGYGTAILKLALPHAKKLGINKVLITCDDGNLGSIKIIEKNGGILSGKQPVPETTKIKRRYWIDLTK